LGINSIKGKPRAIGNRVLVRDMYFGEQKTKSGIIIKDDNGTTRGIYPRWGKVYSKGPMNNDPYNVGDWILIEHGRWTRAITIEDEGEEFNVQMVETESILAYSEEKPDGFQMGAEYNDGAGVDIRPEDFGAN
jgi:co-chaperonin GroES (HSP10)